MPTVVKDLDVHWVDYGENMSLLIRTSQLTIMGCIEREDRIHGRGWAYRKKMREKGCTYADKDAAKRRCEQVLAARATPGIHLEYSYANYQVELIFGSGKLDTYNFTGYQEALDFAKERGTKIAPHVAADDDLGGIYLFGVRPNLQRVPIEHLSGKLEEK